jgi:hypothetical protein
MDTVARMVACGVLRREIEYLAAKNGWRLDDARFLDASLHADLGALETAVTGALGGGTTGEPTLLVYGDCHPHIDRFADRGGAVRLAAENCVEALLGPDRYREEARAGAYFLLEAWADGWDEAMAHNFGGNEEVIREVFQDRGRYLLCLRTPVSGDYAAAAENASRQTGLPIRWLDVGLDRLERLLADGLLRAQGTP